MNPSEIKPATFGYFLAQCREKLHHRVSQCDMYTLISIYIPFIFRLLKRIGI